MDKVVKQIIKQLVQNHEAIKGLRNITDFHNEEAEIGRDKRVKFLEEKQEDFILFLKQVD